MGARTVRIQDPGNEVQKTYMPAMLRIWRLPAVRVVALLLVYGILITELARVTNNLNVGSDFVEYWAAARLNLAGQNPYAGSAVWAVQHDLGFQFQGPVMMYNPPWGLAIALPFGLLPYRVALMLWLG